ncbi:MAG: polysaccharide deacetylase family protein [Candidatus Fimenecus sp.]
MKIWTVSKKSILIIASVLIVIGIIAGVLTEKSVSASAAKKKLPVYAVETDEKKVAVTFDAAWTNQDTQQLIEILKKHNAKATFFIVGDWAGKFPESVKALSDAGHTIANHSDTHKAFSKCSYEEIKEEIVNCNEKLEGIIGKKVTLVRAPSGDYTDQSLDVTKSLGMTMIQWDVDSLDYTKLSVDEIVGRVVPSVKCGSIILFHNGVENTAEALDRILTELEKQGYSFVSVEELIYKDNYTIDHTGRQHKTR